MTSHTITIWILLAGVVMIAMSVLAPRLDRVPFTAPLIYFSAGMLLGPTFLGLVTIDPLEHSGAVELFAEIAVLISLFITGVKLPLPPTRDLWQPPIMIATLGMVVTIAAIASACIFWLGWPIGEAILLGALLAPTDPVLAKEVQTHHPGDRHRLRVTLTCEAGINDGAALPFVLLGLGLLGTHELGDFGLHWFAVDVLYKGVVGVLIGVALGLLAGRLAVGTTRRKKPVLEDLLSLGLVAAAYGLAELANAGAFLAVFAAAVALRGTELWRQRRERSPTLVSEASLDFEESLARVVEIGLVFLLGAMLSAERIALSAVSLGALLVFVARPLGVAASLAFCTLPASMRVLTAWFGLRGLGSVYYAMYALENGLSGPMAKQIVDTTLVVIAMSVLLHGITVTPLMKRFGGS